MKKLLALMLCVALTFGGTVTVFAEESGEPGTEAAVETAEEAAGEDAAEEAPAEDASEEDPAVQLLADVQGTYEELFTVICDPQYDQLWLDDCAAVVGEDMAPMCADILKSACCGTIYGDEAAEAYAADPEAVQFDCFFIGGVDRFVFEGSTISGMAEDGSELFSYEYQPAGEFSLGGMMDGYLYETDAEDAGMFRYFLLMPDTPASTYHIEFRYGESKEDLALYDSGSLAYWLAAGIPADCDEQMIKDVIELFCTENLADMAEENADAGASGNVHGEFTAWGGRLIVQTENSDAFVYRYEEQEGSGILLTPATGENAEVIEISDAEGLMAVADDLGGTYELTADIDLGGAEWTPIGTFVPLGSAGLETESAADAEGGAEEAAEDGEEAEEPTEVPDPAYAFTGVFNGNGYTISNFTVSQPEGYALGLFGCTDDAVILDLNVSDASVDGSMMSGAVIGYSHSSYLSNVNAADVTVTGHAGGFSNEGMFGGIVGASMESLLEDCSAAADVVIPDETGNAGILGGGFELTSLSGCSATGSVTAGNGCYGLGGLTGCGFGAGYFKDCAVSDVTVTAGTDTKWFGGITGYAGGYEDETLGVPVTVFSGCTVENVSYELGEGSEEPGDIVGSGFYSEEMAAMGEPFDAPTVYVIED